MKGKFLFYFLFVSINFSMLFSKEGDLNNTPLQNFLYQGDLKNAYSLINNNTNINIKNEKGNTALHIAAGNGYIDIVEKLLIHGANKNIKNNNGLTAYDLVPRLKYGADKELRQLLLTQVINSKNFPQRDIYKVSTTRDIKYKKKNITEKEVVSAIKKGIFGTKELLTKISVNKRFKLNKTLLHYAVALREYPVVIFLVQQKALLSERGGIYYSTALQDALYFGYLEIAHFLIQKGTILNIKNSHGDTALHIATSKGYFNIAKELLAHGASKYTPNGNGLKAYDLIPKLTFEDNREIKKLLKYKEEENRKPNQKQRYRSMSKGFHSINDSRNSNIKNSWNKNRSRIDKKSKILDSDIGMNFESH